MPYLGSYAIDDYLTFAVNTHNNKGQARDADSVPTYRIYEDETATPLLNGSMALLDSANTVGFYSERVQLTAASGFELNKIYTIYIEATVQGTNGTISHIFQIPTPQSSSFNPLTDTVIVSSGTVTNVVNPVAFTGYATVTGTVVVGTNNDKTGYSLSTAGIDAIFDNDLSNNTTTGTAGYALTNIQNTVNNLSLTGAPSYEAPSSYVLSTGTQIGGTYLNVDTSNGVYHVHTDSGGLLSLYYQYTLKSDEQAVSVLFKGRINGINDSVFIEAYDWTTASWVSLYTLAGVPGATDTNISPALVSKYTGTGADSGKVRIRFINAVTLTTATLYIDQLIIGKTITNRSVGYQDALIWVDTNASNTNTVAFIDGVADNPVSTVAAVYSLASSTGLKGMRFLAGSTITLTQAADRWRFVGAATINLNSQSIEHALFRDAYTINGVSTGEDTTFINCGIGTATIHHSYYTDCKMKGTLTLTESDQYIFDKCLDAVDNGTATFVFSSGTNAYFRDWRGGIQINGLQAGSECIIDGAGRVIIDPTCTGGSLTVRGHFPETTGLAAFVASGGVYTDNARWAEDQSVYAITDGWVTASGTVQTIPGGYVQVTGTVVASSVISPVTVTGYVNVTGTVVASSVTGNIAGTVQAVVDGYVTITGTVVASSVIGNVGGNVLGTVQSVVDGYVTVTGSVVTSSVTNPVVASSVTNPVTVGTNNDKTGYSLVDGSMVFVTGTVATTLSGYVMVTGTVVVGTNNDKTDYVLSSAGVTAITNDVFSEAVEGTLTFRQWVRRVAAVLFGKSSGGGAVGSKKFRDMADAVDRVDATTDANGNRTSTTFDDS